MSEKRTYCLADKPFPVGAGLALLAGTLRGAERRAEGQARAERNADPSGEPVSGGVNLKQGGSS